MNLRMTLATGLAATTFLALASCSSGGDDAVPGVSPSASTTATATSTVVDAKSLVGDWAADESEWIVHFHEDGTFIEDFQGITDFRIGKYEVAGDTVSLIGDDGNTTAGTITGATLVFALGTLIRS